MSGYCGACGHALTGGEQFCSACGTATAGRAPTPMVTTQALPAVFGWSGAQAPGNAIPEWLLEKPNWGALLFGWWWTLWNGNARLKWIGFAMVVPINVMTVGLSQLGFSVYLCIYGKRRSLSRRPKSLGRLGNRHPHRGRGVVVRGASRGISGGVCGRYGPRLTTVTASPMWGRT
jgi:hypothetical protein